MGSHDGRIFTRREISSHDIICAVTKADYQTLAAFRHELRKFLHFSEKAATGHGIPAQQYLAILAIAGSSGPGAITIGELADQLCIAAHSAVGLVDRLEASGYVDRQESPADRRRVHVRLTKEGRRKLRTLAAAHHRELQTAGPLLMGLLRRLTPSPRARTP